MCELTYGWNLEMQIKACASMGSGSWRLRWITGSRIGGDVEGVRGLSGLRCETGVRIVAVLVRAGLARRKKAYPRG